jgi:hypothetical protein
MRAFAAAVALGALVASSATAFQQTFVVPNRGAVASRSFAFLQSTATPCDTPDIEIPEGVTARMLRSAVLTNANGESVTLGDKMGSGTSVIVFLRHLGWPYCWSYAKDWCDLQQKEEMGANGIAGPIFVSIGDAKKLEIFLEKNPHVNREQALVDNYSFGAYEAAGFGRFDDQDKDVAKEAMKNMAAPQLGWKGAWDYMTSVTKVSPVPDNLKFGEIPEGVLRLGGTFVVKGDAILYRWSDRLPGDHPDINNVLRIAKEAANSGPAINKLAALQFPKFFGL